MGWGGLAWGFGLGFGLGLGFFADWVWFWVRVRPLTGSTRWYLGVRTGWLSANGFVFSGSNFSFCRIMIPASFCFFTGFGLVRVSPWLLAGPGLVWFLFSSKFSNISAILETDPIFLFSPLILSASLILGSLVFTVS